MYAKAIHTCQTCGAEYSTFSLAAECHPQTKKIYGCGHCGREYHDLSAAQLCCTKTESSEYGYVPMETRETLGQMRLY